MPLRAEKSRLKFLEIKHHYFDSKELYSALFGLHVLLNHNLNNIFLDRLQSLLAFKCSLEFSICAKWQLICIFLCKTKFVLFLKHMQRS